MLQRLDNRLCHYFLLLAVGACLFLVNLGGPALWDLDEGRNATATGEMRDSGDLIKPTFNGQLRSHKPILIYWLQLAACEAFGVNEFAIRLPSALAAILTTLLVYELGRRMFNASTGLLGGLVLASTTLFCASAHFANPDALLLTFTTATLLLFWLGYASGHSIWWAFSGVACGLAVLAKGPVGFALPGAVAVLFLLWAGQWRQILRPVWIAALVLCGFVSLPWFILISVETKLAFLSEFWLTHNLERALNPQESHSGPVWYYLAVLVIGLVPWSVFMGSSLWYGAWSAIRVPWCAARQSWSHARDAEADSESNADCYRLLWCWIAVYLLAFTIAATKLPSYILPVFPPMALLIARFLDRWRRGVLVIPGWVHPISLTMLTLTGVLSIAGLLILGGAVDVGFTHFETWPGMERWWAFGLVPLVGVVLGIWCLRTQRRTTFVTVVFIAALGFLAPIAGAAIGTLDNFRAPRPLVEQAGALQRDRDIRIGSYQLDYLPSLNFYVQRNVEHLAGDKAVLDFLAQPLPVFLFLPRSEWEQLAPRVTTAHTVLASHREMYRAGEVVVVTNR